MCIKITVEPGVRGLVLDEASQNQADVWTVDIQSEMGRLLLALIRSNVPFALAISSRALLFFV